MVVYSAPGKVILFGEHAVVYGKPAIALAVNRRIYCDISEGEDITTVNGREIDKEKQGYLSEVIEQTGVHHPLRINTDSELPSGAGMGSSAALTVSALGCLLNDKGDIEESKIAEEGFKVEYSVQGSASPIDTSTSTHGSAVMLSDRKLKDFLWNIEKGEKSWKVHHRDIPEIKLVIGYTGVHARTGPLVQKVRNFYEKSNFAQDIVDEIGEVVNLGSEALEENDLERVGELMNRNHKLLSILGISHPSLEALCQASRKYSYGAKLTGAGGGGSMIAITDEPSKVAEVIRMRGGTPYMLESTDEGLTQEK